MSMVYCLNHSDNMPLSNAAIVIEDKEVLCYVNKKRRMVMASNSKKTGLIRKRKRTSQGKKRKKITSKISTPAFSIHVSKDE